MFKVATLLSIVGYVAAVTIQDLINQQSQIITKNAINYKRAVRNDHLQSAQVNPLSLGYTNILPSVYMASSPEIRLQIQWRDIIKEARNKELVLRFLQRVFAEKDFDAIDEYLSENFIQHSHDVADGREGLKEAVKMWLKDIPKREKEDVKRVAADGDLVWVHLRANFEKWGGPDEAVMEIYRVENGKIAEHWDVLQNVPKTPSKNNNTIF